MLPLVENDLSSEDDWHALGTALVVCRYCDEAEARARFESLPPHLQSHQISDEIRTFLTSSDRSILDAAAARLTQRPPPIAWAILEKL